MLGTSLVYSSHDRSPYLHREFIVERALKGWNKRVLFLPMSETPQNGSERERQDFSWGSFQWYFERFRQYGLDPVSFYWSSSLNRSDLDYLWHLLWSSDVVILGGDSVTGIRRYKELGLSVRRQRGQFGRILHERREQAS